MTKESKESKEPDQTNDQKPPEDYLNELVKESKTLEIDVQGSYVGVGRLPTQTAIEVIKKISSKHKLTEGETMVALAYLFQKGASTKGCNPSEAVTINGNTLSVKQMRTIMTQMGLQNRDRQLARTLSSQILEIAIAKDIPGNLSRAISSRYDIPVADRPYYSDFYEEEQVTPERKRLIEEHLEIRRQKQSEQRPKKRRKRK